MASLSISSIADVFPASTSVGAYPASGWSQAALPPSGAPPVSATASGTVASGGSLSITGLADGTAYFLGASVSGTWRYRRTATAPAAAAGGAETDPVAEADLATHAALTTSAHGGLVASGDSRLTNTRTPTDGTVTDAKISSTLSPSKITGTAVITTDARLSDGRTPLVQPWAASTAVAANEMRTFGGMTWASKGAQTTGTTFDPLRWRLVADRQTNNAFRGLTPMVSRLKPQVGPVYPGTSGTQDSDFALGHTVLVDGVVERVRFAYIPAAASPESTTGLTAITFVSAALQYGGVIYKLRFGGKERFTLDPEGGSIDSDPVMLPVVAGQTLYTKAHSTTGASGTGSTNTSTSITGVTTTSRADFQIGQTISGTDIPAATTISDIRGSTIILSQAATGTTASVALTALGKAARGVAASTAADGNTNAAMTSTNNAYVVGTPVIGGGGSQVMGPVAILGRPSARPQPIVGILGDSVDLGTGNTSPSDESFITQALTAGNIPHVNISCGGDQLTKWVASNGGRWRMGLLAACTSVVIGQQTNDLATANRNVAQVQSDILTLATQLRSLGVSAIFTRTDTPRPSMSTNGKAYRLTINDWKRDGHPIDATTKAAVATGTSSNVLRGGDAGHPITHATFETADVWEDARNSGVWVVAYDSGDGVHPSPAGHTAAQAVIAARLTDFV